MNSCIQFHMYVDNDMFPAVLPLYTTKVTFQSNDQNVIEVILSATLVGLYCSHLQFLLVCGSLCLQFSAWSVGLRACD